jgi:tetratricopeptide (TPR) repeat protein
MNKLQRHSSSAFCLLAILCISSAVSLAQSSKESNSALAQTSIEPFAILPASDALVVLDLKRFKSDFVPRLLVDEPKARALVIGTADPKMIQLLDPQAIQRLVVGVRYSIPPNEKSPTDFEVVTIAQSSEAGQLPALIRSRGAGRYREQQYAGKLLYITSEEQTEQIPVVGTVSNSDETEWAITALDANTLVFGSPSSVRASIDVNSGTGKPVSAELVEAVKRNSKALVSAAGQLPPSSMFAGQPWANSDLGQMLSSVKRFSASVELMPAGLVVVLTLNTTSNEQTKSLGDFLGAFKTLASSVVPGKTSQEKAARDLIKGLAISAAGTEVQIRDEITQASANELAKQYASKMYFSQGLVQSQKGDFEASIVEYDKVILLDPYNANAFVNRGKARANKGDLDAAFADYEKAISLDPENAVAYNNRCYDRDRKGDFEAAIPDCDKAIALDPTFAYPYNNRGLAFASLGKLDKAMADYDKSIALDDQNIYAYRNRGDLRTQIENWDGAIADFDKCIAIDAKSTDAYNSRGLAHYYKGEVDQALDDYDKALSLDPNSAITYNNRGLALVEKGKLDQAMADYDKSIALNDKDYVVYINRGHLRNEKKDWNGALADFDKALALNPKSANAYNGRGFARFSTGELNQAIADFDSAIAIDPKASTYLNRGYLRYQKSDYDGAIADFDKVISLDPKSVEAFNGRGLAHHRKDNLEQAIADYDQAINIEPGFAEAYGNRALSLLVLRKDAQAERDLKKCFELDQSLRPVFDPLVKETKKTRRTKPGN